MFSKITALVLIMAIWGLVLSFAEHYEASVNTSMLIGALVSPWLNLVYLKVSRYLQK